MSPDFADFDDKTMDVYFGIASLLLAAVIFFYGDRALNVKEGWISKVLFSHGPQAKIAIKLQKYLLSLLLFGLGLSLIFS